MIHAGVNSGWANNCGVELFTVGWVQCPVTKVKGGSPEKVEEQFVPIPRKTRPLRTEPYNLLVEPVEEVLKEALLTGTATVGDVTLEFDSVPVKPESPISRLAPALEEIKDSVEREIAEMIRTKELSDYQKALELYEVDLRKFEEEFFMFLILLE